ncbi:tRNA lysidine(34) synthetase TilS [Brevibacterium luteolum]|uniref:tRNA lysidine(34) synthetase TilS n=1 Tax=Brevibacterium luteolum TaxID=199591 RepID=UPI0021AF5B16|nr:tRNA lysidine(34) synthetase TilS [Brevibacterium luteolum]
MTGRRPRLDAATAAIRNALRSFLDTAVAHLPASDSTAEPAAGDPVRLIIAVSGGADSLALADAAAFLTTRPAGLTAAGRPVELTAATVDHGLQPATAEVCTTVRDHLTDCGLPTAVLTHPVTAGPEGLEAAARTTRYTALDDHRRQLGATAVLTAHTRDDQAETVLLGLARGSGARSLAGMRAVSTAADCPVWRPLLDITRAQTAASAAARHLPVWHDPMNDDAAYTRVRVRQQALPALEAALGPGVADALARTGTQLAADTDALDDWAAEATATHTSGTETHPRLADLPAAIRTRVVRAWLHECTGRAQEVTAAHIAAVDALATGRRRGAVSVPAAAEVVRTRSGQGPAGLRFQPAGRRENDAPPAADRR